MRLDEMAALIRVGRRTAERMRDAVEAAFGPLEREDDGPKVRFRLVARGLGSFASASTAEELAELENAARALTAAERKPGRDLALARHEDRRELARG
jgi:predicted DNA-binding transcriptional regulator YafY